MKTIHYLQIATTGLLASAVTISPSLPPTVQVYVHGVAAALVAFLGAAGIVSPSALPVVSPLPEQKP